MIDVSYSHEVYPNAPLKLVACELRYQLAPGADLGPVAKLFYDDVEGDYPLQGPAPEQGMRVEVGPSGPVQTVFTNGFRYLSRDKTHSVAVSPLALIVETSAYTKFEEFSAEISRAINVLGRHVRVAAVERIGLRYIDETTLRDLPGGTLRGYFNPASLACSGPVEGLGEPSEFLATTSYALGGDRIAVMRVGKVNQPIVAANGPLRIPNPSTAPLFVIDIDCAWTAAASTPLPFDQASVGEVLADLHVPVRTLFEHTITDKLRNDVLRKEAPAT